MTDDPWKVLREGNQEAAFRQLRLNYDRKTTTSNAMTLGIAYLWERCYGHAAEHFEAAIRAYPLHASVIFASAGVARWCANQPSIAVEHWRAGLECRFADAAGGIKLPLLLFFASVMEPELVGQHEAKEILHTRVSHARGQLWPTPLAQYVLELIDEVCLRRQSIHENPYETASRQRAIDFFVGSRKFGSDANASYRQMMQQVACLSWEDYDKDPRLFYAVIWEDVFFLARHQQMATEN